MPVAKWPAMLGEAQTNRVAPIAGDAVSLEIVLGALGEPVHLFGGIRDFNIPLIVRQGRSPNRRPSPTPSAPTSAVGPSPTCIDRFLGRPAGPLDADGIARTGGLFDLWFRRADDFFLFSFKRDVLLEVGRQLAMVDAERPAQIRLHIDDLTNKQIANTVNGYGYTRARDTSAQREPLHEFAHDATPRASRRRPRARRRPRRRQIHLPPRRQIRTDRSPTLLHCRRGWEGPHSIYHGVVASATRTPHHKLWVSTAPPAENRFLLTVIPADYQMPLMGWFRGLSADVARVNDELWLTANLDMVHIEVGPPEDPAAAGGGLSLPSFGNLFSDFGAKKDEAVKPASAEELSPSVKK